MEPASGLQDRQRRDFSALLTILKHLRTEIGDWVFLKKEKHPLEMPLPNI